MCVFVFSFYHDKEEADGPIVLSLAECSSKSQECSRSAPAEASKLDVAGRVHRPGSGEKAPRSRSHPPSPTRVT